MTTLLQRVSEGDASAQELLFERVYGELRDIARSHMARAGRGHTLQPTALVHEAYLKLVRVEDASFENRRQFYGLATRIMRGLLVDHARAKGAQKRGNGEVLQLDTRMPMPSRAGGSVGLLDLGLALEELHTVDEQLGRVAELRYLGGLDIKEIAAVSDLTIRTVERRLQVANSWLRDRLDGD